MLIDTPASIAFAPVSPQPANGFPSGHAFFAIMILGLLAYFAFITVKKRLPRVSLIVFLIALILLVGVAMVYMGSHWPSDILGGYLIGGVFLTALIWFHRSRISRHRSG